MRMSMSYYFGFNTPEVQKKKRKKKKQAQQIVYEDEEHDSFESGIDELEYLSGDEIEDEE